MDLPLPPNIINKEKEYEVEEVQNHRHSIQLLVY